MEHVELVIKIPKKTVNAIKDNAMFAGSISSDIRWDITSAIVNGTPLPKGHGRLGDLDAISLADINFFSIGDYRKMVRKLTDAPTIIEADKAEHKVYRVKVINRGNCIMCGKKLTEGLLFCKECEAKGK